MSRSSNLPQGRITRLFQLIRLSVNFGLNGGVDGENGATAQETAERLAHLRGLAAKFGQLASYVDGMISTPEQQQLAEALSTLQNATVPSNPDEIRQVVESELEKPIRQLFCEWEDEPFASASIGQVHAARLPSGEKVAVKVQHPGVAEAVKSDLANSAMLEQFVRLLMGGQYGTKAMFEEMAAGFTEELDYTIEARHQERFQNLHRGDELINVPKIVESHSAKRVLTSEFVSGQTLKEAAAGSAEERKQWCSTLWRFMFKGFLRGAFFNADPNPANFIFHSHGKVTFLDFGCTRNLTNQRFAAVQALHAAALDRNDDAFAEAASEMMQLRPGRMKTMNIDFIKECMRPLIESPFRIQRSFATDLAEKANAILKASRKLDKEEISAFPSDLLFVNRLHFGFYSVLARLDVEVDYAAIERQI
jgi:predicted unusual protein kinase regulating ubiquinone biosynthesis (AarF/ABC1/UbiB family)